MKKIGIIGVGKIGSQLAFDVLKDDFVSEIHISRRNQNGLNVLLQSLQIAAFQSKKNVLIKEIDYHNLDSLDLIIISAKDTYDPRIILSQNNFPDGFPKNLRYCGFFQDIHELKKITIKLSNYKGIIAVITNPVEMMTKFVSENVKTEYVFGLGASLDSSRVAFLLNQKYGINVSSNEIMLFGEHGNQMNVKTNLLPIDIENFINNDIITKSNNIGFDFVKKIGYTLFDCIYSFTNDVKWLLNVNGQYKFRSFSYPKSGLIISQPIFYDEKKHYKIFNDYSKKEMDIITELNGKMSILYEQLKESVK